MKPSPLPRVSRPRLERAPSRGGSVLPAVSVCIANWNCKEQLADCLQSLRPELQEIDLEIIVVDNGSTDGAPDLVAQEFPWVTLVCNPGNLGFSHANNQAASRACGTFLFFLNNDTVIPPGTLRKLVEYLQRHPHLGMIGPRLLDENQEPQVSFRRRPTVAALLHRTLLLRWTGLFRGAYRLYRQRGGDFTTTRTVEVLMGAALLVRRELFIECGGWSEEYRFGGEDMDLCLRVGQRAPVVYYPEVAITHLGRVSSRQNLGFAHGNTVTGITHFLRKTGVSSAALVGYKLAVTLDLPLQCLAAFGQYLCRRLCGKREKAQRSWLVFKALGHFLTLGLPAFWRA